MAEILEVLIPVSVVVAAVGRGIYNSLQNHPEPPPSIFDDLPEL